MKFTKPIALILVAGLSSCGGGGSNSAPPTAATTPTPSPTPSPSAVVTFEHVFSLEEGTTAQPNGPLFQASDGKFYGTSRAGGLLNCPANVSFPCGTLFSFDLDDGFSLFHRFDMVGDDGFGPRGTLIEASDGLLYGVTGGGAPAGGAGTVYRIDFAGNIEFVGFFGLEEEDGFSPAGTLIEGTDGNFYGATFEGGAFDCPEFRARCGTIFRMTPNGEITYLYNFTFSTTDGAQPNAPLVQAPDGTFYGATNLGGETGDGTLFRMTPEGDLTTLHSFGTTEMAGKVPGNLILASDGNFYGTAIAGGTGNNGTIFRLTMEGEVTTLFDFGLSENLSNGSAPRAGLFEGDDGLLYGTTAGAGVLESGFRGDGTLFRISKQGEIETLFTFGPVSESPGRPISSVIQGTDGGFYGILEDNGGLGATGPFGGSGALFRFGTPR